MYLENMYKQIGNDNVNNTCKSLFRPWDSEKQIIKESTLTSMKMTIEKIQTVHQDSTVSTTVREPKVAPNGAVPTKKDCYKNKHAEKRSHKDHQSHKNRASSLHSTLRDTQGIKTSPPTGFHPVTRRDISPIDTRLPIIPESGVVLGSDCYNMLDPFCMYPEFVQNNFVNTLGISPNDPLLFESLAQGYALEEYARVLSQEQQAKLLNSKKQRPKKYKCPHCDVGFSNNGQLKGHIRIHTGERPFKCDAAECGKTFTRNEELTRHKRIHSGLRPYACSTCGKRFGRKDHLKKHARTHLQQRALCALPLTLPPEAWAAARAAGYPCLALYGY